MARNDKIQKIFMILADIKGCASFAGDEDLIYYHEKFLPKLMKTVSKCRPVLAETWGNTLFCLFETPSAAAECALAVRDFFREFQWGRSGLPELGARISVHSAAAYAAPGKGGQKKKVTFAHFNLPRYIEPVLRAGEVWTSDTFVRYLEQEKSEHLAADNMGANSLALKWGGQEIHRLRRASEPSLEDGNIYEKADTKRVDPVAILLSLYDRGNDEQQLQAVKMLGKSEDSRAVDKLCAIARDGSLSLRFRLGAVVSLGAQKSAQSLAAFAAILSVQANEDPRLQIAAIQAIMHSGLSRGGVIISDLLENIGSYQEAVVRKAIESLAVIRYQPAVDTIARYVMDGSLEGRSLETGLNILIVLGDRTASSSAFSFLDQDVQPEIRLAALTYLVGDNPLQVWTELGRISRDRNEPFEMRVTALSGLSKIDTNESRVIIAEIAAAAESLSSYAAQFLMEGKERAERLKQDYIEDFMESIRQQS